MSSITIREALFSIRHFNTIEEHADGSITAKARGKEFCFSFVALEAFIKKGDWDLDMRLEMVGLWGNISGDKIITPEMLIVTRDVAQARIELDFIKSGKIWKTRLNYKKLIAVPSTFKTEGF